MTIVAYIPHHPRHEACRGDDAYDADHVDRRAGDVVDHSLLIVVLFISPFLDPDGGGCVVTSGGGSIEVSVQGANNLEEREGSL